MTASDLKWFHRGKEARSHGRDRQIGDSRLTSTNRQAWYAGWDVQDRYMRPQPTPEQEAERAEALAGIREFLDRHKK